MKWYVIHAPVKNSSALHCFDLSTQKERKILESKRLDLDACKNRLRKAKSQEAQTNVSQKSGNEWQGNEH